MSKLILWCGLLLVITMAAAFGQEVVVVPDTGDTTVVVPYGAWLEDLTASFRNVIIGLAVALMTWLSASLPGYASWFLKTKAAEQWLTKAVDRGINAVVGATKGQKLEVNVGHKVAAEAAQYMVDNAPKWLIEWLGGHKGILERVITRVDMVPEAAIPPRPNPDHK